MGPSGVLGQCLIGASEADGLDAPRWHLCAEVVACLTASRAASVHEICFVWVELAKRVFQLHGVAADGKVLFRRRVRREKLTAFLASQPACDVVMEAWASAYYWACLPAPIWSVVVVASCGVLGRGSRGRTRSPACR